MLFTSSTVFSIYIVFFFSKNTKNSLHQYQKAPNTIHNFCWMQNKKKVSNASTQWRNAKTCQQRKQPAQLDVLQTAKI